MARRNSELKATDDGIFPIELAEEAKNFIDGLLDENVVDQVANEHLHRGSFLLLTRSTLWWVALRLALYIFRVGHILTPHLIICVLEQQNLSLVEVLHALLPPHQFNLRHCLVDVISKVVN